jgi:hypothetical protein
MPRTSTQVIAVALCVSFVFYPVTPAVAQANQAGQVTERIPRARVERPGQELTAEPGVPVLWNDIVSTEPRGRVRVTLQDGSILNVGSESSLQVVKHDATTQETDLVLTYGKMRVRTQKVGAGQFQVRTNTAVLGVIGTDFYVFSGPTQTIVIVYEGVVLVTNINAAILGSQQVFAGQQAVVNAGKPPSPPSAPKGNQFQDSVQETEVGESLPSPQPPKPPPVAGGVPTWVWIVSIAGLAAVSVAVPVATQKNKNPITPPPPRKGCPQRKCE